MNGSQNAPLNPTNIVWFRRDLRLGDNPAWAGAVNAGLPICALFVLKLPLMVSVAGLGEPTAMESL